MPKGWEIEAAEFARMASTADALEGLEALDRPPSARLSGMLYRGGCAAAPRRVSPSLARKTWAMASALP